MRRNSWIFGILTVGSLLAASVTRADEWADYATVSMTDAVTPKLMGNRVCYSDGRDIACDGAGGALSTSGSLVISTVAVGGLSVSGNTSFAGVSATHVSATGNVSAAKFIGDGSLLTNIGGGTMAGSFCGMRAASCIPGGAGAGASGYVYYDDNVNIPCNGQTLTVAANGCTYTYDGEGGYYWAVNTTFKASNCPGGYTGVRFALSSWIISCIKS